MFGKQALEVVREYSRLRYSLAPYLFAYGNESTQSGLPMMRPMVLEFPDEPRIDAIDDQYMLGPDLLVAPVFQPGLTSRPIYLPAGQWWAFERNGSTAAGPGYHYADAPLNKIPLFARAGAVIPRYKRPPYHLKGSTPKDWLLDIYPGDSQRHLTIPEKSFTLNIDYSCKKGVSLLGISPAPITLDVRLVDRRPIFVRAGDINLQPGSGGATFQVDVSRGVRIEFKV